MLENNPSVYRLTQKYPKIPDISGNTRNTRKYPKEKKIPGNTRSYFLTLLPDPNPTRYPVFCPIPDPILKNPTHWALLRGRGGGTPLAEKIQVVFESFPKDGPNFA